MKIYDASGFDSKLTGSFTGSFTGDGSNLTGIVTYTKAEISGSSTLTSASLAASISNILDGTSTVASASTAITASFALNAGAGTGFPFSGSADITGSLTVSQGAITGDTVGNIIPFYFANQAAFPSATTYHGAVAHSHADAAMYYAHGGVWLKLKNDDGIYSGSFVGDGSQLTNLNFNIVSSSIVEDSFTSAPSHSVSHNFGTKNVHISVYEGDTVFIPNSIVTTDNNTVDVVFGSIITGRIVVTKGGHLVSGSTDFNNIINTPTLVSSSTFPYTGSAILSGSLTVTGSLVVSGEANKVTRLETTTNTTVADIPSTSTGTANTYVMSYNTAGSGDEPIVFTGNGAGTGGGGTTFNNLFSGVADGATYTAILVHVGGTTYYMGDDINTGLLFTLGTNASNRTLTSNQNANVVEFSTSGFGGKFVWIYIP